MTKRYRVGLGLCVFLCAAVLVVVSGAVTISAPVAVPIAVMIVGPMLAAAALIGTCSLVGPAVDAPVHADMEQVEII